MVGTYPCITTACRRRVDTIRRDHVVDRREVDGVVGNSDQGGEDHGHDPMDH